MIILKKDGVSMEVCNDVQASIFVRNGYVRAYEPKTEGKPVETEIAASEEEAKPVRRRRRAKAEPVE